MCAVCGCGETDTAAAHALGQHDHAPHSHDHPHDTEAAARTVHLEQAILTRNQGFADANRRHFAEHAVFVVNLVSSPGSGKTSLLLRTIEALKGELPLAVIEGDQQTDIDARRIDATGVPARQINTGKGCHLDAHAIGHAIDHLPPIDGGVLFIENVGNLVCPAGFDLGEAHKVVVLSVTEGDDKPLKYPDMFFASALMLLNKIDLLPYVSFDPDHAVQHARRINPDIGAISVSATSGAGMDAWLAWLRAGTIEARKARQAVLQARRAAIDRELASLTLSLGT
jgi:hydrogenase nickel incorporation protein HypB